MFLDTKKKTQEYVWLSGGDLNSFRNIWTLPVKEGKGPPCTVMTYIPSFVP
jgi:hypothetical protein